MSKSRKKDIDACILMLATYLQRLLREQKTFLLMCQPGTEQPLDWGRLAMLQMGQVVHGKSPAVPAAASS